MWLKEEKFTVRLGGNNYIDCPVLIAYSGTPMFSLYRQEDGHLGIDFEVFSPDSKKIASVKRNNIHFSPGHRELYEFDGDENRLTLKRKGTNDVLVEIKKRATSAPAELSVAVKTYLPNGDLLDLGPNESRYRGILASNNTFERCGVGIGIG